MWNCLFLRLHCASCLLQICVIIILIIIITSCRRAAATICRRPCPPPWAPKRLAPPSRRQRSISFPRPTHSHAHRCSRLTRQHGGEQSGLVTLTFDLLTLKVVFESRVTWATSVSILFFLGLSVLDLGPIYATDRQTSDSIIALCPRLLPISIAQCTDAYRYWKFWRCVVPLK